MRIVERIFLLLAMSAPLSVKTFSTLGNALARLRRASAAGFLRPASPAGRCLSDSARIGRLWRGLARRELREHEWRERREWRERQEHERRRAYYGY